MQYNKHDVQSTEKYFLITMHVKPRELVHICNPTTEKTEAEGLKVKSQSRIQSKIL